MPRSLPRPRPRRPVQPHEALDSAHVEKEE